MRNRREQFSDEELTRRELISNAVKLPMIATGALSALNGYTTGMDTAENNPDTSTPTTIFESFVRSVVPAVEIGFIGGAIAGLRLADTEIDPDKEHTRRALLHGLESGIRTALIASTVSATLGATNRNRTNS